MFVSKPCHASVNAVASLLVEDCGPEGFTAHLKVIVRPNYRKVRCVHRLQHKIRQARFDRAKGRVALSILLVELTEL